MKAAHIEEIGHSSSDLNVFEGGTIHKGSITTKTAHTIGDYYRFKSRAFVESALTYTFYRIWNG